MRQHSEINPNHVAADATGRATVMFSTPQRIVTRRDASIVQVAQSAARQRHSASSETPIDLLRRYAMR